MKKNKRQILNLILEDYTTRQRTLLEPEKLAREPA